MNIEPKKIAEIIYNFSDCSDFSDGNFVNQLADLFEREEKESERDYCSKCGTQLQTTDHNGKVADYCEKCDETFDKFNPKQFKEWCGAE